MGVRRRRRCRELDQEVDGRWIAEVPELNILLYESEDADDSLIAGHNLELGEIPRV
jgi:hypothetical protein